MRSIALALGASFTWGISDFFGPLKGRTLGALRVLVYVQLGGLIAIAMIVAVRGKGPADSTVLFAIPAAISGTLGFYAYYRGMAVGAMSVVAPIAGVSAIVPVIVGVASGDRPSGWQLLGIACALLGGFFAAASSSGLVSITSVLASLYPIVTVVLARIFLGERVARSQEAGVALTLAGVALISAG